MIVLLGSDVQPVAESVNKKRTTPGELPVARPLLSIVATQGSSLVHVPPVEGKRLVVSPTHIFGAPEMILGDGFIIVPRVFVHPVCVSVNVKYASPGDTAVTNPLLSIVATNAAELCHVPLLADAKRVVSPTQSSSAPEFCINGAGKTVKGMSVVAEQRVVLLLNVKKVVPELIAVTNPAFVTVATTGFRYP